MLRVGDEVRRLQEILTSPKLRGQMGEWSLETLLANVLPQESYDLQHSFKDGRIVDALVRLRDFSVPIDAKFPLPAFQRLLDANTDAERKASRRQFLKDVTVHIDKIADAYIRPAEGTLDFALMYIPAENVYYETVVRQESDTTDLIHYGMERKVIPVSPNLLYAYLMTVAMGLHGLRIEQEAADIRQNLRKLSADLDAFTGSWDTLGAHLRNAHAKYDETQKRMDRFTLQLDGITGHKNSDRSTTNSEQKN
jgi:DNA recombination protein RmuC